MPNSGKEEKLKREAMAERLAALTLSGVGVNRQVTMLQNEFFETGLTRTRVDQMRKHPRYKEVIQQEFESAASVAILEAKLRLTGLLPEAMSALKYLIKVKKNVNAIALVFKNAGLDAVEQTKQEQAITVIMPGASHEKPARTIEVTAKDKSKGPSSTEDV